MTDLPSSQEDLHRIAQEISQLMQLDRIRHQVSAEVNMAALSGIPAYLTRVFVEKAGAVSGELSPAEAYV